MEFVFLYVGKLGALMLQCLVFGCDRVTVLWFCLIEEYKELMSVVMQVISKVW